MFLTLRSEPASFPEDCAEAAVHGCKFIILRGTLLMLTFCALAEAIDREGEASSTSKGNPFMQRKLNTFPPSDSTKD